MIRHAWDVLLICAKGTRRRANRPKEGFGTAGSFSDGDGTLLEVEEELPVVRCDSKGLWCSKVRVGRVVRHTWML